MARTLISVVLLLLQVHVIHVSSFSTQQQPRHGESLSRQARHWSFAPHAIATTISTRQSQRYRRQRHSFLAAASSNDNEEDTKGNPPKRTSTYNLGVGKNPPVGSAIKKNMEKIVPATEDIQWNVPDHPNAKVANESKPENDSLKQSIVGSYSSQSTDDLQPRRVRRMVARTEESSTLRGAIWHEEHYSTDDERDETSLESSSTTPSLSSEANSTDVEATSLPMGPEDQEGPFQRPELFYPNIDLSIPPSVYNPDTNTDIVWDLMRWEAYQEAQREPLLVSFLYSSILNHETLESSLAFLLANKLSSAAMISTQVQSLILDALDKDSSIGRSIRADIMAVRDRDPACTCLPDVFLYFKGFHALQTYRVAHAIWKNDKQVLAHYLQSQMSQTFQIDIHPNATLGSGIMLDHGTGIVIGETSHLGHNCSILHHVTLGGSGKKGVDRHPKVGDGVLLGAGASVLGNIQIGDGCQVGAGGLVITDLPPHSVAVGVPVKIIGSFVDITQPSVEMNQMMNQTFFSEGI